MKHLLTAAAIAILRTRKGRRLILRYLPRPVRKWVAVQVARVLLNGPRIKGWSL